MTDDNVIRIETGLQNRMVCKACGITFGAPCKCGVNYVPWKEKAADDAIAKEPQKSNRAIASDLGIGQTTVRKARNKAKKAGAH